MQEEEWIGNRGRKWIRLTGWGLSSGSIILCVGGDESGGFGHVFLSLWTLGMGTKFLVLPPGNRHFTNLETFNPFASTILIYFYSI